MEQPPIGGIQVHSRAVPSASLHLCGGRGCLSFADTWIPEQYSSRFTRHWHFYGCAQKYVIRTSAGAVFVALNTHP